MIEIKVKSNNTHKDPASIVFVGKNADLSLAGKISTAQKEYLKNALNNADDIISINLLTYHIYATGDKGKSPESFRKLGHRIFTMLKKEELKNCSLVYSNSENIRFILEGILLTAYTFNKYLSDKNKVKHHLKTINLICKDLSKEDLIHTMAMIEGTYFARDLVNEPHSYLTAMQFAEEIKVKCDKLPIKFEAFNLAKIESLKMGGILAVNKGSIDPPVFITMEYKPKKPLNKKPIVFVGKGVVYDTGGLSLKATENSMDMMKCDMAGGAVVAASTIAIAKAGLPYHIITLIPATDNRPGGNAFAPGDVIHMMDGTTVEVMNTDAEGRLILADALTYADRYKPELVIDFATLTGSSVASIGQYGTLMMGTAKETIKKKISLAGENAFERIVEFPMWEEYGNELKSEIADLRNIGGKTAGAITAGKFLEHFVNYPWLHFDIAGPSFLVNNDSYRLKGGSGFGVRLLFDFINNYAKQ